MASAQPARHLHVVNGQFVDDQTGEVIPPEIGRLQEEIAQLKLDLKMAQRDVKTKNRQISMLEQDRVQQRIQHPRRADIQRIATYWHRKCRPEDYARATRRIHPMSDDRFDAIAAILDQKEQVVGAGGKRRWEQKYTLEMCRAAIDGAKFDPFEKKQKNGRAKRFDDLALIFRDGAHFEDFRDRAPVSLAEPFVPAGRDLLLRA